MAKIRSFGLLALLFFTLKGIAWLVVLFLGTNSFWKYIQG
jgi:phage terminase large subunit-like protein